MKHFDGQVRLLKSQNDLIQQLREEVMKKMSRFNENDSCLGPDVSLSGSFVTSKKLFKLCEINPFCGHVFKIIDETNNSILSALDASDRQSQEKFKFCLKF